MHKSKTLTTSSCCKHSSSIQLPSCGDASVDNKPTHQTNCVKVDLCTGSSTKYDVLPKSMMNKREACSSPPTSSKPYKHTLRVCFSPSGKVIHFWYGIVSLWVVYHMWVIIYRRAFAEINPHNLCIWFPLDYLADFFYLIDIIISVRTGFLEDGVMQYDTTRMRIHYLNSTQFYIDCLCLLPLDFLYLSIGWNSLLRIFRLCKMYKFWHFLDRVERHASRPNIMRSAKLMFYYLTILHWNACIYKLVFNFMIHSPEPESSDTEMSAQRTNNAFWNAGPPHLINQTTPAGNHTYLAAVYWGMVSLFSVGTAPTPMNTLDYMFNISQKIVGILLFATILGHVSNIITHVSAGQKEFQARLDRVKNYLSLRRVPYALQAKVIDWFDYLWYTNKITDEDNVLTSLPDKLKAEIAIQMHLDTLKRVEMFQNTEEGFLSELVLRLRMVLFAPGDFVCRKGEIGKQMFIVNRGTLHVLGDDNRTVLATLRAGSYFGELSILNLGQYGNRRSASVRSLGYSDLFRLSKSDLWDVLKDYPGARRKLEAHAYKKIDSYKMPLLRDGKTNECEPGDVAPLSGSDENLTPFAGGNAHTAGASSNALGHTIRDSSDGYGSDPSRLSALVGTPQQSPTPPVPLCTCAQSQKMSRLPVCSEHAKPVFRPSSQPLTESIDTPSDKSAYICQNARRLERSAPLVMSDLANPSAFTYFTATKQRQGEDRRTCNLQSMVSNRTGQAIILPFGVNEFQNGLCDECEDHIGNRCIVPSLILEKTKNDSHRALVKLGEEELTEVEHSFGGHRQTETGLALGRADVPTICFEKASSSSSSSFSRCSCARPRSNSNSVCRFRFTSCGEKCSFNDYLNTPQANVNSQTSLSRNSWYANGTGPVQCGRPLCTTPSLFGHTNEILEDTNEYALLLKELSRLQHRIYMLERENAVLQRCSHPQAEHVSLDSMDQQSTELDDRSETRANLPVVLQSSGQKVMTRVSVKRSSSLQVPAISAVPKCRRTITSQESFRKSENGTFANRINAVYFRDESSPHSH